MSRLEIGRSLEAGDSGATNRIERLEKRVAELEKQAQEQPNIDKIVKVVERAIQSSFAVSCGTRIAL